MTLFMHTRPTIDGPPAPTPGIRCLKSWIDHDPRIRQTLMEAPDRAMVERAWPNADVVELFAPVERWLSVAEIRSRGRQLGCETRFSAETMVIGATRRRRESLHPRPARSRRRNP